MVRQCRNGDLLVPVDGEVEGVQVDLRVVAVVGTELHSDWTAALSAEGLTAECLSVEEEALALADAVPAEALEPVGLIGALRYQGDEVQWSRALHGVCADAAVATVLARAVLDIAVQGRVGAAQRLLARMPEMVVCSQQQGLVAVGRGVLRGRVRRAGIVDLVFSGPDGWRLTVELKINDPLTAEQIGRYLDAGESVMAVVRDPLDPRNADTAKPRKGSNGRWLGAIGWSDLLPTLRALPIGDAFERQVWLTLIEAMDRGGDFAARRLPSSTGAAAGTRVLDRLERQLIRELHDAIVAKHGKRAEPFANQVVVTSNQKSGRWANRGLRLPSVTTGSQIHVAIYDADAGAPIVRVDWFSPPSRPARSALRAAHDRLQRRGWQLQPTDSVRWVRKRTLDALAVRKDMDSAVTHEVRQAFHELVGCGALAWDLDLS